MGVGGGRQGLRGVCSGDTAHTVVSDESSRPSPDICTELRGDNRGSFIYFLFIYLFTLVSSNEHVKKKYIYIFLWSLMPFDLIAPHLILSRPH